ARIRHAAGLLVVGEAIRHVVAVAERLVLGASAAAQGSLAADIERLTVGGADDLSDTRKHVGTFGCRFDGGHVVLLARSIVLYRTNAKRDIRTFDTTTGS